MTPQRVDGQRDVVKNERRQSYENQPYGMASIEIDKMLCPANHPYNWPTIGYMEDLTAASHERRRGVLQEVLRTQQRQPGDCRDIDFATTRTLVEKWFNEIPRGAPVEPIAPPAAILTGVQKKTLTDQVALPRLYLAWLTPRLYAPGDAALDVVSSVLPAARTHGSTSDWSTTRRWRRTSPRSSNPAPSAASSRSSRPRGAGNCRRAAEGDRRRAGQAPSRAARRTRSPTGD
jgi:predicted Zn-dependent peptidase